MDFTGQSRPYVLIVNGDVSYGELLANRLEEESVADALLAQTVEEALEQLLSTSIGLVVAEYHLGDERGTDLLNSMLTRRIKVPFLLISDDGQVSEVAELHGVPFIAKSDPLMITNIHKARAG